MRPTEEVIATAPTPANPLRILMYTAYFEPEYSGAALQALTLARELRKRGHHIEFVTNRWPGLPEQAVVDGFRVQRLQPGRTRKHREFRLWFNLARYCWMRRGDFDIIHSHGAYFTNAFIGPLARLLGKRSVIKASLAHDDLQDLQHPVVGWLHRQMLLRVDACVAISGDLAKEFDAGGIESHRVHRVPNGVDTQRFTPASAERRGQLRQSQGLPQDRPIVLYLGVLDQRKNIVWLAEQWVAHRGFGTGALLVAVGPRAREDVDGALHARLLALASAEPELFAVRDHCPDPQPNYHMADLLVLPSVKEGLPNVVLEAMACGLPCVVARGSGSRELVADGRTGYTYEPNDARALGEALVKGLSGLGPALGAGGLNLARSRYAINVVASAYEQLYAGLLRPCRRVLFVENGIGYGGAIICLRHLVRNLDRRRFDPLVVTGLGDAKYQDIANDSRWKQIPDKRVDVIALKRTLAAARWPDRLPGMRWLANQVLSRVDDVANFLPSLAQTLWTVLRFRPHIIHVNNEPLCNRAAVLAGKVAGVPVVAHVRGDQQGSLMMHSFFKLPDHFIPVSRWVSESIGRLGVHELRRTYIYDGIELDKLDLQADGQAFRARHGIDENAFVVGLVGLIIPWKGQSLFLDAAERLADTMPNAVFAIVGGTPDEFRWFEAELRERVRRRPSGIGVVFTGHVSDMASVYNGLDIVISASTSPEPLGTMIIEAMTMQRPIVAPDHGGAVEMIEHERTGLLFSAGNAQSLAAAIQRLHADRGLGDRLGTAARAQALRTFSIAEHVRQVETVYERLLSSKQAPRAA